MRPVKSYIINVNNTQGKDPVFSVELLDILLIGLLMRRTVFGLLPMF
jgi:hypothetical protein